MDTNRFKSITAGIQSIIFSIGLIVAGMWGVYEFYATYYESLDLSIDATQVKDLGDGELVISIKLLIKNDGKRKIAIPLSDESIIVSRVLFDNKGRISKTDERFTTGIASFAYHDKLSTTNLITSLPNSDKIIHFLVRVHKSGPYLIEFLSDDKSDSNYWFANTYVVVK